ncbi:hypothetical protein AgCh_039304 [Apium graveolens]
MYGHNNTSSNDFSYHFPGDLFEPSPVLDNLTVPLPSLQVDCLMIPNNEFDSVSPTLMMNKQQLCNNPTSIGYSSYGSPTSLTSYEAQPSTYMMHKSSSSHSLHNNINGFQCHQQITQFSGFDDSSPVRKVFSTGDLQYVCRKTLADSRPRIRGRFAKNNDDENEKGRQLTDEWNHTVADNHGDLEDDNQHWINFVDTFSANAIP